MDALTVNTLRTLSVDAVQQAKSGHQGTPMAMAPVLWQRFLRFDPQDPTWPNRDRFVLSPGHASVLLYLTGVQAVDAEHERVGEPVVRLQDLKGMCGYLRSVQAGVLHHELAVILKRFERC